MDTFDLKTLSALTGVSPRTVHFYVQQGLIPPPEGAGRGARYTASHRDRLALIRRLQEQYLPLAEIRKQLAQLSDVALEQLSSSPPTRRSSSAADYIRTVLAGNTSTAALKAPAALRSTAPRSTGQKLAKPQDVERSQWERISLDADVEIHLRRPLSRTTNRKVDRLLDFARAVFREEP